VWLVGGFNRPLATLLIGLIACGVAYALSLYVRRIRSKAALWADANTVV
jgi:hypothetical protein